MAFTKQNAQKWSDEESAKKAIQIYKQQNPTYKFEAIETVL